MNSELDRVRTMAKDQVASKEKELQELVNT